jgi:hypothetical protein
MPRIKAIGANRDTDWLQPASEEQARRIHSDRFGGPNDRPAAIANPMRRSFAHRCGTNCPQAELPQRYERSDQGVHELIETVFQHCQSCRMSVVRKPVATATSPSDSPSHRKGDASSSNTGCDSTLCSPPSVIARFSQTRKASPYRKSHAGDELSEARPFPETGTNGLHVMLSKPAVRSTGSKSTTIEFDILATCCRSARFNRQSRCDRLNPTATLFDHADID